MELNACELYVVPDLLGTERYLEAEVRLRLQHALFRRDGDHVALLGLLLVLAHCRVAEVVHLDELRNA